MVRRPAVPPGYVVAGLGLALFLLSLWHFINEIARLRELVFPLAALVLDGVLAAVLVYAGYHLMHSSLDEPDQWGVVAWCLGGVAAVLALTLVSMGIRVGEGRALAEPTLEVLLSADTGGIAGYVAGFAQARARRDARAARRAEEAISFLNGVLRHDVRNSVSIIQTEADRLATDLDGSAAQSVRTIRRRCEELVRLTGDTEAIVDAVKGEATLQPVPLQDVARSAAATARETFPMADVTVDVPEVDVRANRALETVFDNLLTNAVEHGATGSGSWGREAAGEGGREGPTVRVTAEAGDGLVTVRVADDGPGIEAERREAVLERPGEGFGLYVVQRLVVGYGGEVRIEESDLGGTAVVFTLHQA